MTNPPAGWHNDPSGSPNLRYWDGAQWTADTKPFPPPTAAQAPAPPAYAQAPQPFQPQSQQWAPQQPFPVQPDVRQARDRAQYTRQQHGHSLIKHLLFGWVLLYIPTVYYAVSPNHYFHT